MRVLVTGGSGFIGRHTCGMLRSMGHEPLVLDRHQPVVARERPGHRLFLGDVRDANAVSEAVAHADGVIHLAGVLGTQETIANPRPSAETNILGAINVFEACVAHSVPCVNIAVGNHWMINTYAITKSAAERLAKMYNIERGADIRTVRALNAYGPSQEPSPPYGHSKVRKVMPALMCRALHGAPVELYGDGLQVMDMIYVEDVARVLVRALMGPPTSDVYEAGTGRRSTVREIAEIVVEQAAQLTGHRSEIVTLPMRPGEPDGAVVLGDPRTLAPLKIFPEDLTTLELGVKLTALSYYNAMDRRD